MLEFMAVGIMKSARIYQSVELVSADRFNRWRLATTIVDALVLSSPVFKEAIKTKHLRVGFFEGLRALLHLIGV